MDRLNELRKDSNKSTDKSILDSSLESHEGSGFETANESSGSKYFSFIEDDPSLQDSNLKDVSLVEGEINDNISGSSQQLLDSANAASMLSQLSPINKNKDSMDNFKIDSHIDAANILSGGVNIFDDNDNSGDENDLVIDDNALSLDTEEDCKSISESNNIILLHTKNGELIKDDKHDSENDNKVLKEKSNSFTEKDIVATGEHVDSVNPTHKIETFADSSSKDDRVKITNSVKSVNHTEAITQQISTKVVKPDADNTPNLGDIKSLNIEHDNIKTAVLQHDIQHNMCFVSESSSQNDASRDIVKPKKQHSKPSIVTKQLEKANATNFGKPQIEQCSTPNGDDCTPTASVQQISVTGGNVPSSLTQNAESINVVVPPPPQHSDVENIMAPIPKHNTDASKIVSSTAPRKTVNDEASLNASPQTENKNIQIATSQPESNSDNNIFISTGARNADTSYVCNSVLSADVNFADAVKTTTSTQLNLDARHIPVPTSQNKCALSDEAMPYKKNKTPTLDTVNNYEIPITSNIAKSILQNVAFSTAQQNAKVTSSLPPTLPYNDDNSSLVPQVQNNANMDNIVEHPVKQNDVETITTVPAVQQKNISEIPEASSPPKKLFEPTAQQNDNFFEAENIVDAVDHPTDVEVSGVEEPPNVLLQIDGRDVVAVDVGNNLYLYRKETDDEVTAIQIVPVENEQLQCKFLNVRHNEEGNFEVYEEHIMDVPSDADKNNEVESTTKLESHGIFKSDDVKNLENKPSHLPKKDLNKVMNIQEVNYSGKGLMPNVSSTPSAVQPDKPVLSQRPSNNDSVPKIFEHKIDKADLQQHEIEDKPNKKIREALPGPSGISKQLLKKSENPMFSSTPKDKLTMKKDVAKSDLLITTTPSFAKPIPNLIKTIETSTSSENFPTKPFSVSTLPIVSNVILEKDSIQKEPMLGPGFDSKIKLQTFNDEKLRNPYINKLGLISKPVNSNLKHNVAEVGNKQDQTKVCIIKPVEQLNHNVKHITVLKSENSSFQSSKFLDESQLNLKLSEQVKKPNTFNLKQDIQLHKFPKTPLILDNHYTSLKPSELIEKQHTTKLKPNVQLVEPPYDLKATVPLDQQRHSIKSYVSLDNPSIKPYIPLAKHRKGNLKTLRPVEKLQNANLKSADKSLNMNLKPAKPQTPFQKPYVILGKQSNSKVKPVGELGKSPSINVGNAALEKLQNSSVKSNLPLDKPKTSRLSVQCVPQIKRNNAQIGLLSTENSRMKRTGSQDQMHTVINMSTGANIPVPLRFLIEPSKKKEITALAHREPEMQVSIARPSGMPKSMDLGNNVYNDKYISEALNVKIQPDSGKETHSFVWSEKHIKNISKLGEKTIKQHLPKKSNENIITDNVSVSVSVLPAHPKTNREYSVIKNQNFTLPMRGREILQKQGCDTTVTAVPVLPLKAKSHSTKEVCKDKEQTDVVIVNLSESSIDGYSEEEISECQPVTGDVDWEAREKALTDQRDNEYIENVLDTIEESISKMDEDKPQPSSGTANTILLNTALHNLTPHPPMDISILPNVDSSPSKESNKRVVKDAKSVITEVDFDKFVRRNSHHTSDDAMTLQLPIHDAAGQQTKTLPGPSETKSNVSLDKDLITHNPNANKSNVTYNSKSHIQTKYCPTKTVPVPNATSKYECMSSERYISSESYHKAGGKSNADSMHPSSYLAGVQKVNESFKFKRAYQSALESLRTKDNAEPTTSNLRVNDKPVTVVILDPEPAAIVSDKAIKGLTLMAHSYSPLVAINNANIAVNSMDSVVAVKKSVEGQNSIANTTTPLLALNSDIVGPKLIAPCTISVVAVNNSTSSNNPNAATTSPSSSESFHNSPTDKKSIHTMQKSKYKHPRKQVLTSVERPDMEIVFPNPIEVDSRSKNVNLLSKGRKRKVEISSHSGISEIVSPLPYSDKSTIEVKPALSNKIIFAKKSLTSDLLANHDSKNPISNLSKTISVQLVTQDKDGENDKKEVQDSSKYTTPGNKDKYVAEYNKLTQDRNETEKTKDATKERDMPEIMRVSKQVNESHEIKKGRGRPRKSILPILTSSDTQEERKTTPININDLDPPTHCLSLDSNSDYSSDDDQVIVNWTMGKIDEKIVCPICSKLFRSENVVFKHVKHCSGPDKVVSPERKSPSFDKSITEEQLANMHTPSKRPRGRPSHKQIAKGADIVKTVYSAEPSISDKDENTALNNFSVEILDSCNSANSTIMHNSKTIEKSHIVPIINEQSETSSENNISSKNMKVTGKVPLKCDTLTPLSRLAKVMKVPVQTNPCHSCETCGKSFRQLSYLANHRRAHHQSQIRLHTKHRVPAPPAPYEASALSCEVCKKGFRKLHHLVQHREIHKCSAIPPSCEAPKRKVTESRTALPIVVTKQEASKLAPVSGFRCEACDKSFRKLYHLVEHRETHDTRARQSALPVAHFTPPKTHSAPLVPLSAPVVSHTAPLVSHPALLVSEAPLDPQIAPSVLDAVPHATQSSAKAEPLAPSGVRCPTFSDHLTTPTVPSCELCGKSFRKLHHLIEHRDLHMVSKDIPQPKIETSIANVKPTLLAKDIIHECPNCYMVFPNEPSLNKHSTLCHRKKRSQSSNQLSDPTVEDASQESKCFNKPIEVFTDAPSKIIPVTRLLATSPVQLQTNEKENSQESNTESKNTTDSSEVPANILIAPSTLLKEESTESDDSEIIFNISKTDCEIRYMINPLFENGSKRPTKRASVQEDISTDRLNQLYRNVSRRTSAPTKLTDWKNIQHSPPKKSKKLLTQSHIKPTTSKTNSRLVKEPVKNRKSQGDDDEDDNNILYSFPNRRALRTSTSTTLREYSTLNTKKSTIPNVNKSLRSSNQTLSSKKATEKSSEKRRSLVGIAKKKNAVLQETLSKANLRRCGHNLTDRAGLNDKKGDSRKRPAPLRHLCDCGELFSSATLLARHTSLAHTPPRIRRPRDAPPPTAHQGVPIPHKMRKAVSGMQF